jgi:DNA adenine methylase
MLKNNNKIKRSPLFYVGDKYKLLNQLTVLFPENINNFYEPFVGGGSVFLNLKAKKYHLNDFDKHLISIHNFLMNSSEKPDIFFNDVDKIINKFKLSRSYKENIVPNSLKLEFKKTYYAKFNKIGYGQLRDSVNNHKKNDPLALYLLLIYGFNRMLRFNGSGKFNLPVGNVDFNKNVVYALNNYFSFVQNKEINFTSKDFREFFSDKEFSKKDFVYIDPPYLITSSEYNKKWGNDEEKDLLNFIDNLNDKGVNFALSNVICYKDKKNNLLIEWMKKYNVHKINSNYISYHHNGQKNIKEVLITNYKH